VKKDIYSPYRVQYNKILYEERRRDGCEVKITLRDMHLQFLRQNGKCAYTGVDLVFGETSNDRHRGKTTASLDRKDSSKGYIKGNIQWVHKDINFFKSDLSDNKFRRMCLMVANYFLQKEAIILDIMDQL
jgi:hypothetical protein